MREIKFRCWRKSQKTMYPPSSIWKMNLWGCDYTDDIILMQFTGLLDKQGKEIYEGDIVEVNGVGVHEEKGKVLFFHGAYKIADEKGINLTLDELEYEDTIEIIGNIYETPEKIKKE